MRDKNGAILYVTRQKIKMLIKDLKLAKETDYNKELVCLRLKNILEVQ